MEKAYPTRYGMPISTRELELSKSRLDPNKQSNHNNHHLHYEAPFYRADFIFNSMRNLEDEQEDMLKDQHNMGRLALHSIFSPPEPPTHKIAMDRLDIAHETGEQFKVYDLEQRKYVYYPFTDIHWKQLLMRYKEFSHE